MTVNVLELFAGVGGPRVGLEKADQKLFNTKWANQWEPSRKSQDAFEVYDYHYPDSENLNISISDITDEKFKSMDADLIVGGFPCQDYSVARSKSNEKGIEGKKGVLFWEIIRATENIRPKYLVLENVDRLLKAPSKQRGRDFAIMLSAFNNLGYTVEWRVINAADYGRPQKRRRIFLFVYRNDLNLNNGSENLFTQNENELKNYLCKTGLFANQFPVYEEIVKKREVYYELPTDIVDVSESFSGQFWNSGVMRNGKVYSIELKANYEGSCLTLKDVVQESNMVDDKYYITDAERISKFQYLRGAKKIERVSSTGHKYIYSEGGMSPYDSLELPARTMLTSEGSVNRSTHLLCIDGKYRLLTPVEAERLQDFPDDWTRFKRTGDNSIVEVNDRMRMFFMGNALVTDIIRKIGLEIKKYEAL